MLTFRITFTGDHMVEGYRRFRRQHGRRRVGWVLAVLCLGIGAILIVRGVPAYGWAAAGLGAVIAALVAIGEWRERHRLRSHPFRGMEAEFTFSDDGVRVRSENQFIRITWGNLKKAVRFDDGLLIFIGPRAYLWMADHELPTTDDAHRLADLARERAGRFIEMH